MRFKSIIVENALSSQSQTISRQNMPEIAIIGGGAAGFFAAISAKNIQPQAAVTIFEKSDRVLTKVLISGGGRCNLTNSFARVHDLQQAYPRGNQLLKRLFNIFDHHDTYRWFEQRGVPLTTQDDECIFPRSQNAASITDCLLRAAVQSGVEIRTRQALKRLNPLSDGRIETVFKGGKAAVFDRVIIATGGSPRAERFRYLADLGHEIIDPVPALYTFNINEPEFRALMGTVIDPVALSIPATKHRSTGALLITHWGMSGPATLKLSSYAARFVSQQDYHFDVSINWLNERNAETVRQLLSTIAETHPKKQLGSSSPGNLSARVWHYLLQRASIEADKQWNELGQKAFHKLIETLTNDIHSVTGKGSFRDEFVTCGGVSIGSIHLQTLESKVCPNLFFAGEVLDIDAITGGFNLQAAWTTGFVAGQSAGQLSK